MDENFVTKKLNRIKARTAKFRQHWCHRCDIAIVAESQRCPKCGYRCEQKRMKNFELK